MAMKKRNSKRKMFDAGSGKSRGLESGIRKAMERPKAGKLLIVDPHGTSAVKLAKKTKKNK